MTSLEQTTEQDRWSAGAIPGWSVALPGVSAINFICSGLTNVYDSELLFNTGCLFQKEKPYIKHTVFLNEKKKQSRPSCPDPVLVMAKIT